ncbi:tyrosine-type recombinase/integrase [Synechocystis sp. CACIAM 05]|uniref:tyrosine-type recombinase/integrase n=1 Tax=Synechocystis sp. CACIAM 05 TaxID=1933929 RepID=UPI00138E6FB2|nr:hypothetical protein [Synechocystis sp. CACIAM 05]QHU98979.1 hypothetical protein BWK47_01730 [Synechocystis sp. CACIAM 05]
MAVSYKKLDTGEPITQGLANLYLKGERIYLRLPDKLGLGRNKYVATGLSNIHQGRVQARKILTVVNNDILLETFDVTLKKYLPRYRTEAYSLEVDKVIGAKTPLQELWKIYCNYKQSEVRESTHYYLEETIGSKVRELPITDVYDANGIVTHLLSTTTNDYARRVITKLRALFDWCVSKKILSGDNPYKDIAVTLTKSKSKSKPARPLTDDEVSLVLNGLPEQYEQLTKFILATGCRPSEAIGLTWDKVKDDVIVLGSSKVKKGGRTFQSESSKNGTLREFPLTFKVEMALGARRKGLVFTNTQGGLHDYTNYLKAWKRLLPDSTPYSARDTFITRQIELGKPIATIAAWVDNSVKVIETTYYKPTGKVLPA